MEPLAQENKPSIVYVGFWERVLAFFIDIGYSVLLIPIILNLVRYFTKGQTIGYEIIGAKICTNSNTDEKASTSMLLMRFAAKLISGAPLLFGFFWVCIDRHKQGWHDKIAGTVVIKIGKTNRVLATIGLILALLSLFLGFSVIGWLGKIILIGGFFSFLSMF